MNDLNICSGLSCPNPVDGMTAEFDAPMIVRHVICNGAKPKFDTQGNFVVERLETTPSGEEWCLYKWPYSPNLDKFSAWDARFADPGKYRIKWTSCDGYEPNLQLIPMPSTDAAIPKSTPFTVCMQKDGEPKKIVAVSHCADCGAASGQVVYQNIDGSSFDASGYSVVPCGDTKKCYSDGSGGYFAEYNQGGELYYSLPDGTTTTTKPSSGSLVDCNLFNNQFKKDYENQVMCEHDADDLKTGVKVLVVSYIDPLTLVPVINRYDAVTGAAYAGDVTRLWACADDSTTTSEAAAYCDDGTEFIRHTVKENGVPTGQQIDLNLDGTPYTPSGAERLGSCINALESDYVVMCDGGVEFFRWIVKDNGQPTGTTYDKDASGADYTASGAETIGRCVVSGQHKTFTRSLDADGLSFTIGDYAGSAKVSGYTAQLHYIGDDVATPLPRATYDGVLVGYPFSIGVNADKGQTIEPKTFEMIDSEGGNYKWVIIEKQSL